MAPKPVEETPETVESDETIVPDPVEPKGPGYTSLRALEVSLPAWYVEARREQVAKAERRAALKPMYRVVTREPNPPRGKGKSLVRKHREAVARKRAKADAPRLAKLQAQKAAEKKAIQKRAAKRIARSEARKKIRKSTSGVLLMPVVGAM